MVVRHRKRTRHRYMGTSRTWGAGNTKRRRGKGSKGGKGMAGLGKHKWATTIAFMPEHFGKHGFVSKRQKITNIINLNAISNLYRAGKIEEKEGQPTFVFNGKVLSRGNIDFPLFLKAAAISRSAKQKIEKAGGKVELMS